MRCFSQSGGSILLAMLAIIAFSECRAIRFEDDNRDAWFKDMEDRFRDENIPGDQQVSYAIGTGLADVPELQDVMEKRVAAVQQVASAGDEMGFGGATWEWFKDETTRISETSKALREHESYCTGYPEAISDIRMPYDHDVARPSRTPVDAQFVLSDITNPSYDTQCLNKRPTDDLALWPTLGDLRRALEAVIEKVTALLTETLKSITDFVYCLMATLPSEVHNAIVQWNSFRVEHPYIAAGAIVAVIGASIFVGNFILGQAALGLLWMLGFSELGPVAGSWAALIQSTFYRAYTRGLFSIVQSITMTAKSAWPAAAFLDLSELAAGTAIFSRGAIAGLVDQWRASDVFETVVFPDMSVLIEGGVASEELMKTWMGSVGDKCREAGVPEVQWLDVAFQWMYREIEARA